MLHVTNVTGLFSKQKAENPSISRRFEAGAHRGRMVHDACAGYAKLFLVPTDLGDFMPFFTSFRVWFDRYVKEVIFVEHTLIHPVYPYGGTADLFVVMVDGRRVLVDLKTPKAQSKEWRLQLAAYRELALQNGFGPVDAQGSLRLKENGGIAAMTLYQEVATDFAMFLNGMFFVNYLQKGE